MPSILRKWRGLIGLGILAIAVTVLFRLAFRGLGGATDAGSQLFLLIGAAIPVAALAGWGWARWVLSSGSATDRRQPYWFGRAELASRRLWARGQAGQGELWFRWGLKAAYPDQAVAYLEEAARRGHAEASFELGLYFEEGGLGGGGRESAARHYRRAAEQGHGEAAFRLAELLRWGIGPVRQPVEAHRWYLRSAHRGFGPAMVWLGGAFERGEGTERNPEEARVWQARVAALAVMPGQRHSALVGPQRGAGEAFEKAGEAVREGLQDTESELARLPGFEVFSRISAFAALACAVLLALGLLLVALGGPFFLAAIIALLGLIPFAVRLRKETRYSRRTLRIEARAAEGDPEACHQLGLAFLAGSHEMPRDPLMARQWLTRAAEGGQVDAMFRLGELLSWNLGGLRDPEASDRWLRQAAGAGHAGAQELLARRNPHGAAVSSGD